MAPKSYYDEDTNEILEIDEEWFAGAKRMHEIPELADLVEHMRAKGLMSRYPSRRVMQKRAVSMLIDSDVVARLKIDGNWMFRANVALRNLLKP